MISFGTENFVTASHNPFTSNRRNICACVDNKFSMSHLACCQRFCCCCCHALSSPVQGAPRTTFGSCGTESLCPSLCWNSQHLLAVCCSMAVSQRRPCCWVVCFKLNKQGEEQMMRHGDRSTETESIPRCCTSIASSSCSAQWFRPSTLCWVSTGALLQWA